jgi:hypothetical protein
MATSYNGWPASPDKNAINVVAFGDSLGFPFPGGVRSGDPFTVLGYVAKQLHYRVEPCISGWCWGYNYRANVNNPTTLSCHASATAIDYNAPNHPNGVRGTWTSAQVGEVRKILAEAEGSIQWGEDYSGTVDGMHFEVIVNAGTLAGVASRLPTIGPPAPTPPEDDVTEDDFTRITTIVNSAVAAQLRQALPRQLQALVTGQPNSWLSDPSLAPDAMDTLGVHGYLERMPIFLRSGNPNAAYGKGTAGADGIGVDGMIKKYSNQ